MTHPQTELPTVEIDGQNWSREKRMLWRVVTFVCTKFSNETGEQVDLDSDIIPIVAGAADELFPELSEDAAFDLCADLIIELRTAFALVHEDGAAQ